MAWHFNNLTSLIGQRAVDGLTALINPNDVHTHKPTKHVFFQGLRDDGTSDGHIHECWWDGNWHHSDLTNNTHAPLATGVPSSYMFKGEGTKHVIYQGFDQGDDGRINELWWDGDWHHTDLTGAAHNAPLTIDEPFGYEYSFFDTISQRNTISQRVVYQTLDHQIHLLLWDTKDGWQHTALPRVPAGLVSRPTAYVFTVQGQTVPGQASQRILYRSVDDILKDIHHVHELTWNEVGPNNHRWQPNDLTVLTGAPPLADSEPVGLMHDLEFTLHVFYSKYKHLYELYWNNLGWHVNDLTAMTGAAPDGPPLAYVHLRQGTLNVNYSGVDGHIHALWREVGKEWDPANQQDLTPGGAPPPASGLVGFVFRDLTQHIFYIGADRPEQMGNIIELTDE